MIELLFSLVKGLVLMYLFVVVCWPFALSLIARIKRHDHLIKKSLDYQKVLVLIPAYQEDSVIIRTAQDALCHNYPSDKYTVCVIADGLKPATLEALSELRIDVITVSFDNSTKAKALNYALSKYDEDVFEVAVVLDADNHMEAGFLKEVSSARAMGYAAIQGRRAPKNEGSSISVLDGLSEEANNHIYGKGQFAMGFSSRLSGSGMAFDFTLFKNTMAEVTAINGFDKELELLLVRRGVRIAYHEEAIIYDEKVESTNSFQRQRTRWLAAQYHFLKINLKKLFVFGAGERVLDYLQKIIILALPPRIVLPVILCVGIIIGFVGSSVVISIFFGVLLVLNVATYVLAIPSMYFSPKYAHKWAMLPVALVHTLLAMARMSRARGKFIHTVHGSVKNID